MIGLYLLLSILAHIPAVQRLIASRTADVLTSVMETEVSVGRVDLGFMNRIIIDDVNVKDRSGKDMISATRMSVKLDLLTLFSDKIEISSGQLFGPKINIYAPNDSAALNCSFLADVFASDDDSKTKQEISIKSFVIRRGYVRYNILDKPVTPGRFNASHIDLANVSGHFVFTQNASKEATIKVKKLSLREKSGIDVRNLSAKVMLKKNSAMISDFHLQLPHSDVMIDHAVAHFKKDNGKIVRATLKYEAAAHSDALVLSDITPLVPQLKNFDTPLSLSTSVSGTSTSLRVHNFEVNSPDGEIDIRVQGSLNNFESPSWFADIDRMVLNAGTIQFLDHNFNGGKGDTPALPERFGDVRFKGTAGGSSENIMVKGNIISDAGNATLAVAKRGSFVEGGINTVKLNVGKLAAVDDLGLLTARLDFEGQLAKDGKIPSMKARGKISSIEYRKHTYNDITIDGTYRNKEFDGLVDVDDPNGKLNIKGLIAINGRASKARFTARLERFNPAALGLTDKWRDTEFDMNVDADFTGNDINSAEGSLMVEAFEMRSAERNLSVNNFDVTTGHADDGRFLKIRSDFADIDITGNYNYETLSHSIVNYVARRLPTLPGLPAARRATDNDFTIDATVKNSQWLQMLLGVPLEISSPVTLDATVNDKADTMDFSCELPVFSYSGTEYAGGHIDITTEDDILKLKAEVMKIMGNGHHLGLNLDAAAADNRLTSVLAWDNNVENGFNGSLNLAANFFNTASGTPATHIRVNPSEMSVGGVKWNIRPSDVMLGNKEIEIDNFVAENDRQHLIVSGRATDNPADSITVNLDDIEVAYVLDLVNFHSVKFAGSASGKAYISSVFGKPRAAARLTVDDFLFQGGRMGQLTADVQWNDKLGQVDIDALADDRPTGTTTIKGYVSPRNNDIRLDIGARRMRAEFLEGFCGNFMNNVTATVSGDASVVGPLNMINLVGDLYVTGGLGIKTVGTNYMLDSVLVRCVPEDLQIVDGKIRDAAGGKGTLNGSIRHRNFGRMVVDIGVKTDGLAVYNRGPETGDTFYGTVFMDGTCDIHVFRGDVDIDVNGRPVRGSQMIYNASAPDAISNRSFIHWKTPSDTTEVHDNERVYRSADVKVKFAIDATPDLALKVILDDDTGDNIILRGDGALNATYYNKGAFNIFGTYSVNDGIYRLTIQNILEKEFRFHEGSSIVFGGDPYDASLDLRAVHTVNGVSLSDLKIGKSFSNNTIRVNCIMGIHGTPEQPRVDFDIDMPTVDGELQQMIRSLITTEEDMNRQVVYILGIGRFFVPEDNNMDTDTGPSQTSLAMQSLLSGTISSQINSVLSRMVNSQKWNFGANISTGDEGWNNAEYEGILSGKLLNNRLLINGQFGYRDNANATTGFIGDFDIRYLLFPNGDVAVRLYNQTNDRYFTKSSLNTQGVGLIMKKDFTDLRSLFGRKKKKNIKQTEQPVRTIIKPGETDNNPKTKKR